MSAYNSTSTSPPLMKKETLNEMLLPGIGSTWNFILCLQRLCNFLQHLSTPVECLRSEHRGRCSWWTTILFAPRAVTSMATLLCSVSFQTSSLVSSRIVRSVYLCQNSCCVVGVNVLWSGMYDEKTFNAADDIYGVLLPAFSDALVKVQPKVCIYTWLIMLTHLD